MKFSLLHLHLISCARTLANRNRGCLHKTVLKVQEKKVRERELNGQTWHIKLMKSWKGTRSSKYINFWRNFSIIFSLVLIGIYAGVSSQV